MIRQTIRTHLKTLTLIFLLPLLAFTIVKLLYVWNNNTIPAFQSMPFFPKLGACLEMISSQAMEHMDFLGYMVALLTFVVSILITLIIDGRTNTQFKALTDIEDQVRKSLLEVQDTNKKIRKSTENLEDATRKVLETLPDILDESIRIVEKVARENDRLYVMNYTSKFGLIHSFNKRFIDQVKEESPDNIPVREEEMKNYYCRRLNVFKARIDLLCRKMMDAASVAEEFNLITYADAQFNSDFISKYIETEVTNHEDNLLLYNYKTHGKIVPDDITLVASGDRLKTIVEVVYNQHMSTNTLLNDMRNCVIKKKNIPYQMILAEYVDEKMERKYESLVIYAVDEKEGSNGAPEELKRNIIGISSKNIQLYKAFKTIFNDVKTHQN